MNVVPVVFEFKIDENNQVFYAGNKSNTDFNTEIPVEDIENGIYNYTWVSYVYILQNPVLYIDYRSLLSTINYIFFGIYVGEATFKVRGLLRCNCMCPCCERCVETLHMKYMSKSKCCNLSTQAVDN